jgi:hypothetical protein
MSLGTRSVPRILLMLVLALVILSMIVPSSLLDFLRFEYGWVDSVQDFIGFVLPGMDMDHLVAFGLLGFVARFGWSKGRSWQVALGVLAVAALVEFVQVWVPGRHAAVSHALMDLIGGMGGYGLAWVLTFAWGEESLPVQRPVQRVEE